MENKAFSSEFISIIRRGDPHGRQSAASPNAPAFYREAIPVGQMRFRTGPPPAYARRQEWQSRTAAGLPPRCPADGGYAEQPASRAIASDLRDIRMDFMGIMAPARKFMPIFVPAAQASVPVNKSNDPHNE